MKIAVIGLGGVGGYFGGKIAVKYAGSPEHRVVFIARGAHLAAIRKGGLLLKTVEGELGLRPIWRPMIRPRPVPATLCSSA